MQNKICMYPLLPRCFIFIKNVTNLKFSNEANFTKIFGNSEFQLTYQNFNYFNK